MRARSSLCALAGCLALAGCSGDDDSPDQAGAGGTADPAFVAIAEFAYEPETITVEPGTELTWTSSDRAPHTATADDGSFDTGTLKRGDEAAVRLEEPGTYTYYCRFHAFMNGTVEVE